MCKIMDRKFSDHKNKEKLYPLLGGGIYRGEERSLIKEASTKPEPF